MKVKLTNVRLSFPELFTPVQFQGKGDFKYEATFLIPAGCALMKTVDEAIDAVAKEKWGAKSAIYMEEIRLDKKGCCWIDGKRKPDLDGYEGHWALSAKRREQKGPVLVLDANKTPLTVRSGKPYAGCYVNATVDIYAQDNDGKAMRCELLAVQFARDGDAFGGGAAPNPDEFEDLTAGATAEDLV